MIIQNNKIYDTLKWIALVALPAVGTVYFAVAQIWGLPDANQVVGTIVAVDTGLGTILHISSSTYTAPSGTMDVVDNGPGNPKTFSLNLDGDPHELKDKDKVTFKVKHTSPMKQKVKTARKRTNNS